MLLDGNKWWDVERGTSGCPGRYSDRVTGWASEISGLDFWQWRQILCFSQQLAAHLEPSVERASGVKRQGKEAGQPSPCSTDVKN